MKSGHSNASQHSAGDLHTFAATMAGIHDYDAKLPDDSPDGVRERIVWLRDIGHTVRDNLGNPAVVRGLMVEITQHKFAGEQRTEAEQRYRRLGEQLPGMVYMESIERDEPGRALYVSPQVVTMLGYRPEEWLADPTLWTALLHPDDVQMMKDLYSRVAERGEPYSADYRMFARDGSIVFIHDGAVLVRDEDGMPVFWLGVMFDVTQQRLATAPPA